MFTKWRLDSMIGAVRGALVCGLWFVIGCSAAPAVSDLGSGAYFQSSCWSCVSSTCAPALQSCAADRGCATYLSCLDRCSVVGGDADPGCEAACPIPASASGRSAQTALLDCRHGEAGRSCAACGHPPVDAGLPALFAQVCTPVQAMDACLACVKSSCCQTYAEVVQDPDALAYGNCLVATPDPLEKYQCALEHRQGFALFETLSRCREYRCPGECKVPPCSACTAQRCPSQNIACAMSADCRLITQCSTLKCTAGDYDCRAACRESFPIGIEPAYQLNTCAFDKCHDTCL